jgi:hypothetical protein
MAVVYLTVNGGTGSGYKTAGTSSAITATATGYYFTHWTTSGATVSNPYSASTIVTVGYSNCSVTAHFERIVLYVRFYVNNASAGYIDGYASQTVLYGNSTVPVTAVPYSGYHFVGWNLANAGNPLQLTNVTSSGNYTASFEADGAPAFSLTVNNGSGDGNYLQGATANIVADSPAPGYHFTYWSGDTAYVANVYSATTTLTMPNSNISVTANYAEDAVEEFTLTYTAGTGGSITGTALQTVAEGGDGTEVTATPIAGYKFTRWGDDVLTASRTDTNVTGDITVTAYFEIIPSGYIVWI